MKNGYFAEWQDSYSLGITDIDDQHQAFFVKYKEFCTAMAAGAGRLAIGEVLQTLQAYANFHFDSEEALMERIAFTGIDGHIVQHQLFRDTIALFIRDFYAGIDILDGVYLFFHHWLVGHIQESDQRIGAFLASATLDLSERLPKEEPTAAAAGEGITAAGACTPPVRRSGWPCRRCRGRAPGPSGRGSPSPRS